MRLTVKIELAIISCTECGLPFGRSVQANAPSGTDTEQIGKGKDNFFEEYNKNPRKDSIIRYQTMCTDCTLTRLKSEIMMWQGTEAECQRLKARVSELDNMLSERTFSVIKDELDEALYKAGVNVLRDKNTGKWIIGIDARRYRDELNAEITKETSKV